MKATVNRESLLSALKNAFLLVPKGKVKEPILQNFLVTAGPDQITISSTNFDETYTEVVPAIVLEPGVTCIPAKKFLDVIGKAKSKLVGIDARPSTWVHLTLDKINTKLPETLPDLFPAVEMPHLQNIFTLDSKVWGDIHKKMVSFVGKDEARKNLMGINVSNQAARLQFRAADAFRIADYTLEKQNTQDFNFTLPGVGFGKTSKIFMAPHSQITFSLDGLLMQMRTDTQCYQSKLIGAEFPNLDRLFEPGCNQATCDTDALFEAVDMLETLVGKEPRAVMKATFGATELVLESQKGDSVSLVCEYNGTLMSIGLSIGFLLDVLKTFVNYDTVNITMSSSLHPCMISTPEMDNFRTVVMPVRTTEIK